MDEPLVSVVRARPGTYDIRRRTRLTLDLVHDRSLCVGWVKAQEEAGAADAYAIPVVQALELVASDATAVEQLLAETREGIARLRAEEARFAAREDLAGNEDLRQFLAGMRSATDALERELAEAEARPGA